MRLMTGGVAVLDGGLLGRLIEGLSHDEKKSSPGSALGVEALSVLDCAVTSVTTTSPGYLNRHADEPIVFESGALSYVLLRIRGGSSLELILVFRRCVGGVLGLRIFTSKGCGATVGLKVLRS